VPHAISVRPAARIPADDWHCGPGGGGERMAMGEVESVANRNEWQPGTAARGREPAADSSTTVVAVLDTIRGGGESEARGWHVGRTGRGS
jgi:hypothetical protein